MPGRGFLFVRETHRGSRCVGGKQTRRFERLSGVLVVKAPFFLELFRRPSVQDESNSNAAEDDEHQRNEQHDEFRLVKKHVQDFHDKSSRAYNWLIKGTV